MSSIYFLHGLYKIFLSECLKITRHLFLESYIYSLYLLLRFFTKIWLIIRRLKVETIFHVTSLHNKKNCLNTKRMQEVPQTHIRTQYTYIKTSVSGSPERIAIRARVRCRYGEKSGGNTEQMVADGRRTMRKRFLVCEVLA